MSRGSFEDLLITRFKEITSFRDGINDMEAKIDGSNKEENLVLNQAKSELLKAEDIYYKTLHEEYERKFPNTDENLLYYLDDKEEYNEVAEFLRSRGDIAALIVYDSLSISSLTESSSSVEFSNYELATYIETTLYDDISSYEDKLKEMLSHFKNSIQEDEVEKQESILKLARYSKDLFERYLYIGWTKHNFDHEASRGNTIPISLLRDFKEVMVLVISQVQKKGIKNFKTKITSKDNWPEIIEPEIRPSISQKLLTNLTDFYNEKLAKNFAENDNDAILSTLKEMKSLGFELSDLKYGEVSLFSAIINTGDVGLVKNIVNSGVSKKAFKNYLDVDFTAPGIMSFMEEKEQTKLTLKLKSIPKQLKKKIKPFIEKAESITEYGDYFYSNYYQMDGNNISIEIKLNNAFEIDYAEKFPEAVIKDFQRFGNINVSFELNNGLAINLIFRTPEKEVTNFLTSIDAIRRDYKTGQVFFVEDFENLVKQEIASLAPNTEQENINEAYAYLINQILSGEFKQAFMNPNLNAAGQGKAAGILAKVNDIEEFNSITEIVTRYCQDIIPHEAATATTATTLAADTEAQLPSRGRV